MTRAEADALDRAMKEFGDVAHWRAWVMWLALRAFGWIKWHGAK